MSTPTAPEAAAPEQKNEIVIPSREALLAPISAAETAINEALAACKGLTVAGHADGAKAGYAVVSTHRKGLKKLRSNIENARKEAKRPLLDLGDSLDKEAKRLEGMIRPEEERLEKEEKDFEAVQAEEKRQRDLAAANRLAERLKVANGIGAALNEIPMGLARDASDEDWAKELTRLEGVVALRRLAEVRTAELRKVGADAPFGIEEWTEEEFAQYLADAADDKKRRDEEAEADLREAEAKREGEHRSLLLAAQGVDLSAEACREMTPDDFAAALETATTEKARRDANALAQREELDRLRRDADARKAEEARKEREAAAARQHAEDIRLAEALRPGREALAKWRAHVLEAVQHAPTLEDAGLCRLRDEVERAITTALDRLAFEEPEPVTSSVASVASDDDDVELEF